MRVLVINAGSSSVKLSVLDGEDTTHAESVDPDDAGPDLRRLLDRGERPDAVGHRVVHGGAQFSGPVVVDDDVLADLSALRDLAPLHQGPSVRALDQARAALPDLPHVACFDTAFHTTLPPAASTYAVPGKWRALGVRRYGFHGLAHEWAARRTAEMLDQPAENLRIVTAHLGSGASLCAVEGGRSVDTTMGFTPTAGLVMGTRSGDLDPAVPLWLVGQGIDQEEVVNALDRCSGLLALTGESDSRRVVAAADTGDKHAEAALQVWAHRARGQIAAMTAAMGGLDVLTFTGGVGEHQPSMRARATEQTEFLGINLDPARNHAIKAGDAEISAAAGDVRVLVVAAREDRIIAEHVRQLLAG